MVRYYLIFILFIAAACTKNTGHVKTVVNPASLQSAKHEILAYADTVNALSINSTKQESLVYTLDDYSFYVSRYLKNSQVSLYVEHGHSANYGDTENRYYLKDGKVVLFISNIFNSKDALPYKTKRVFYYNGSFLSSDQRLAGTKDELESASYLTNDITDSGLKEDMKRLNDAIYQQGRFDLRFEGITEYPKARYLILSRNSFNSYRAAILVKKQDELMKSIIANPEKYQGRRLGLTWNLKNKQAEYVSGHLAD